MIKVGRGSSSCRMQPFVHSFVSARAEEEGFFDFNETNGTLTPCFTRSGRACLLTSQGNSLSSYKLWANYTDFPRKLKSFKAVRTLFNVNESLIDINEEWFSRMKYLSVLHLGHWSSNVSLSAIGVIDQHFLKYLKNMKRLRLLHLRGLSPITRLPDSICKLIDLRILDLRECTALEELPADIGSLKNLIYLDITTCRLLSKLPKGIRLLSKLEVLKGFIITHQREDGGRQDPKMFILEDLSSLRKLSNLSLIVYDDTFPNIEESQLLKNLHKLTITWENHLLRQWERPCENTMQSRQEDTQASHDRQSNLRKLVLICFPLLTAPRHLLDPGLLEKLEELYISGGELEILPGGTGEEIKYWNVKTLRLKYLRNLSISWPNLRSMFPQMTYLEEYECENLPYFPCDAEGVWRK